MAWIQVDEGIKEHDKIYNLADTLKISNAYAVGLMVCFWTWAATSAPDGDVTNFPPRAIAKAAGWEKKADVFYNAIISEKICFLEKRADKIYIKNWELRAELLMEAIAQQKEKTRQRVQRFRERKKKNSAQQQKPPENDRAVLCNDDCNVTVTPCNAPTKPNPTIPNRTVNQSGVNNNPTPPTEENINEDEMRVLSIVGKAFEETIKPPSGDDSRILLEFVHTYRQEQILAAIAEAHKNKGHSVKYVKAILEGWKNDGKRMSPDTTRHMDPDYYKNVKW